MPLDKEHKCIYKVNADKGIKCECSMCSECKINPNYIPRTRLEELATLFKDGHIEDDKAQALIYFDEVCEMTDSEKEFFWIETEGEEE